MTAVDTGVSFAHEFVDRVNATPDAEAFRGREGDGWRSLTWGRTKDEVFAIAAGLIDLGVAGGERVAIASSTRLEWVLVDLGILCAGAANTTVYPTTAADEVGYILADSQTAVVIAEDAAQVEKIRTNTLPDLRQIVVIDPAGVAGDDVITLAELMDRGRTLLAGNAAVVDDRIAQIGPEDLATLVYTSGTTGRPKGVRLVHANWVYEGRAVASLNILQPDDVQYLWLPLSHVLGKVLMGIQLRIGFCTVVDGDLSRIVANLAEIKPTFMGGAPRIFEKVRAAVMLRTQGEGGLKAKIFDWAFAVGLTASRIRQNGGTVKGMLALQLRVADKLVFTKIRAAVGGRIKFFVSGSAALSREVAEWFDAAGMKILEGYGLTESSAASFVNLPDDVRIGTVGPPVPGTEVIIAADGEVLIRGGGVMRGYHNLPEATEEVLTGDGWLHTGDIGELVDGYLRITDRKKDLIKTSGGKYVAPQKVEGIFKALCPYASQIVVHGEGRKFVSALVTLDPDTITGWAKENGLADKTPAELAADPEVYQLVSEAMTELNKQLERWETIKKFAILPRDLTIEDGELTPSLKVRRKAVERKYMAELDRLYTD